MELLGLILTVLLLVGLFIALRRIERWLHQHIFKVGWLVTHNYQTTTILYYTFFLPGVVLHEVIYWLVAGIFNVRAEHSIQWPDVQEIGELKLNFVQISNRAAAWRKAIISIAPLVAGILATWFIAENILQITAAVAVMSSGELSAVTDGFAQLTQAPNFWLWVYIVFTIANTMFPQIPKDLRGWRSMLLAAVAVFAALTLIGLGGEIFEALTPTINTLLDTLLTTLVFLISIDVLMVLILGTIEYTIERVTGHSATFKGGKMITMTREEALEERRKERERERRRAERQRRAEEALPTTVYALAFPVPGSPSDVEVTPLITEEAPEEPRFAGSGVPDEEQATQQTQKEEDAAPAAGDLASRIRMPQQRPEPAAEETEAPEEEETEETAAAAIPEEETAERGAEEPLKPTSFSRRPPIRLTPDAAETEQDEGETEEPSQPAAFAPRPPISLTPELETASGDESESDDEEPDETPAAPAASRFGVRPPQPTTSADARKDQSDDEEPDETPAAPAASRFGVRPPEPATSGDDGEKRPDDDEKPAARWRSAVKPFQPSTPSESEDEHSEDDQKAAQESELALPRETTRSAPARFSPRPFQPRQSDDEEDEKTNAPARPSGFSSRLTPSPTKPSQMRFELPDEEDDEKQEAPRSSLRFGSKPFSEKPATSASDDETDDETSRPDSTPAGRLGGFGSTLGSTAVDDEDDVYYDDEDEYYDEDDEEYLDYEDDD